jgi:hypothetical protein
MSKKIPLERLREISRQRSTPKVDSEPGSGVEPGAGTQRRLAPEWPIRSSLWL